MVRTYLCITLSLHPTVCRRPRRSIITDTTHHPRRHIIIMVSHTRRGAGAPFHLLVEKSNPSFQPRNTHFLGPTNTQPTGNSQLFLALMECLVMRRGHRLHQPHTLALLRTMRNLRNRFPMLLIKYRNLKPLGRKGSCLMPRSTSRSPSLFKCFGSSRPASVLPCSLHALYF